MKVARYPPLYLSLIGQPSRSFVTPTVRPSPAFDPRRSRAGDPSRGRPATRSPSHRMASQTPVVEAHEALPYESPDTHNVPLQGQELYMLQRRLTRLQEEQVSQEAQLLYSSQKIRTATQHVATLDRLIARGPKQSSNNQTEENLRHRLAVETRSFRNASLPQLNAAEKKCLSRLAELAQEIKDVDAAVKYKENGSSY